MSGATHPSGRREQRNGRDLVVFTRTFRASAEDVWAAITEPSRLEQWVGTWDGDPADGYVAFRMTAEGEDAPAERMTIDECDPPRRLALHSAEQWYLELDVHQDGDVATLTFAQRVSDPDTAASVGPGWDYYLDRLVAAETGRELPTWESDGYLQDEAYYRSLFS